MKKRHLLLGCKGCGNAIVEAAFAVAGVPLDYEEVDYSGGSPTRARLLEVNPLGQVPSLVLPDGRLMTESLAMIQHVNDLLVAALYPTFTYGDEPGKWVEETQGAKQLRESTDRHRQALWRQVEDVAGAPWFLGERMSALDFYIAVMTHWRPGRKWFTANTPKLLAIAEKTAAIPKVPAVIAKSF